MSESIRMTPLSTHIGADLSKPNPGSRAKTANPSPAALPKGGSQIESLKALGSRTTAGKREAEAARAPLTRELSFREWIAPTTKPTTSQDDEWSELDDIFRRPSAAGQVGAGAPTHSLIDAPQTPLRKSAAASASQGPAVRQEPARAGSSGMLSAIKRSAKNLLGFTRSSSQPTPKQVSASPPPRAAAAPENSAAETVQRTHEQNGRPTTTRNAIPKLSVEQARREGKPVPTRRPPPPMTGSAGEVARPAASARAQNNLKPKIGAGMAPNPQPRKSTPVSADRRGEPAVSTTSGRFVKRTPQQGRSTFRPQLPTIAEHRHETGPLASIGQHYAGLARDLRGSVNGAYRALQSVRSTPRKELAAKRAELEGHAAQLKRLIAETGMAEVDLGTVQALKQHEAPASSKPDSLRVRAILVDRDIHEAGRQRNHARVALDRLERAIARLPQPTGR